MNNTYRRTIQIYPGFTIALASFTTSGYYNVGNGNVNFTQPFAANTWYELESVLVDNGDNTDASNPNRDMLYTYINGSLVYSAAIDMSKDYKGTISNIALQSDKAGNRPAEEWDIDYIYMGEYNGATASVESAYNTSVGQSIAINPTLTGTNPDYDASISYWTPVIEDESKLIYNSESGKFEGLAEGSTTVTFDFADPLIQDVTTTVNVGAAQGETKVEDIELSEIFANDTISLVPGESYDLDDLLTVSPVAATNKELNYVAASDSNSIYSLDGSVVTATAKGTSTLTVNSADGNATKTLTIKVEDGYLAQLPAVGTTWDEINVLHQDVDNNYYTSFASMVRHMVKFQ